jgi:CubicO group peptidase (beta-lactamase class C family)
VPKEDISKVAVNYDTGLPLVFPLSTMAKRALSASWGDVVKISNEPRFMEAIIPAANIVATADEMSQFFQMLLNGGKLNGRRIFKAETIRQAINIDGGVIQNTSILSFQMREPDYPHAVNGQLN